MPLDITPVTITLNKVRVEQFTVSPQLNVQFNILEVIMTPKEITSPESRNMQP